MYTEHGAWNLKNSKCPTKAASIEQKYLKP